MSGIDTAFPITIGIEGALSLDPEDRGNYASGVVGSGPVLGTMYGVSAMAYAGLLKRVPDAERATFPDISDIPSLTLAQAKMLYQFNEWAGINGDALPLQIACLTFDATVNMGVRGAIILQQALGVDQDGDIGPQTVAAAHAAKLPDILDEISVRRIIQYTLDSEWRSDGLGWTRRVFSVLDAVKAITLPGV